MEKECLFSPHGRYISPIMKALQQKKPSWVVKGGKVLGWKPRQGTRVVVPSCVQGPHQQPAKSPPSSCNTQQRAFRVLSSSHHLFSSLCSRPFYSISTVSLVAAKCLLQKVWLSFEAWENADIQSSVFSDLFSKSASIAAQSYFFGWSNKWRNQKYWLWSYLKLAASM